MKFEVGQIWRLKYTPVYTMVITSASSEFIDFDKFSHNKFSHHGTLRKDNFWALNGWTLIEGECQEWRRKIIEAF